LTATDSAGESASAAVSIIIQESPSGNQAPEAQILSPTNNATYTQGSPVSFSGTGTDPEEVGLSGAALSWSSNIDGLLETGVGFTWSTLSPGDHTISLTATDSEGLSHTDTVTITITPLTPSNTAPVASIDFPKEGNSYLEGDSISFSGAGLDSEDGSLTGQALSWTSDGSIIGYGQMFQSSTLSVGTHAITLTATDSGGLSHQTTVNIMVTPAQAADMSGTWYYYTTDTWSQGNCPTGSASQGTLTISQSGNNFTLTMSRMTFTGAVVNNYYACSNTSQIEGGTQTTTLGFQRQSDTSASGTSTTVATFTETSCQWGSSLYLYR
jgi:hypothetical protein